MYIVQKSNKVPLKSIEDEIPQTIDDNQPTTNKISNDKNLNKFNNFFCS